MKKLMSLGIAMSFLAFSSLAFSQQTTPEQIKQAKADAKNNPRQTKGKPKKVKPVKPVRKEVKKAPATSIYREKTSSDMK